MSASRSDALRGPLNLPGPAWWLVTLGALALTVFVNPLAGFGLLGFFLVQRAWPFDFLIAYLVVVFLGSFIDYGGGHVAFEMSILAVFIVFMLFCYVLSRRWDSLVFPRTRALLPLMLFFGLTVFNFIRGLASGNSLKFATLEILAVLALVTCLLTGNRRLTEHERRTALIWLWVISFLHFARGAYVFALVHRRTIGTYFTPVPGLVAMMLFNYALRARTRGRMLFLVIAMVPLLTHQFLSFTRGFWLAIIGGMAFSLIVYIGRDAGARVRARRSGTLLVMLAGFAAVGVGILGAATGVGHLFEMAGSRFASSAGTKWSWESSSNVIRLVESFRVLDLVLQRPWFGYGLGYTFVVREPVEFKLVEQWFCHENYLLITFKQGLLGLAIWIWLLIEFVRIGVQGRRLPNLDEQAWCTGFAALVVFVIVYSFVHFPMAETPTTFAFALAGGVTMRYISHETIALRWKGRRTLPPDGT